MKMMQAMGFELTITWEVDRIEATAFGETSRTYIAGAKEWKIVAKSKWSEYEVEGKDLPDVYAKILKEVLA